MVDLISSFLKKNRRNWGKLDPDNVFETQEIRDADLLERVREIRNEELKATDIYLLTDYPISASNKTKIETYRAALRDLPETEFSLTEGTHGELDMTDWPEVPDLS